MKNILFLMGVLLVVVPSYLYFYNRSNADTPDGIFVLHSFTTIESRIPAPADKSFPTVRLNAKENTITGFTGCNNIKGRWKTPNNNLLLSKNHIKFELMAVTRKACPKDTYEARILKAFNDADTYEYSSQHGMLTLKQGKKTLLILRELIRT